MAPYSDAFTPTSIRRLKDGRAQDPDAVHADVLPLVVSPSLVSSTSTKAEPIGRMGRDPPQHLTQQQSTDEEPPESKGKKLGRALRSLGLIMLVLAGVSMTYSTENLSGLLRGFYEEKPKIWAGRRDLSRQPSEEDSYTLIVIRCKNNVEWLREVPSDWRMVIYDKCGRDTNDEYPFLNERENIAHYKALNVGAEECNGYFDYMLDYYDDLTDVNIFVHDDALKSYDKKHSPELVHTPFDTFEPLVNVTREYLTPEHPFLHYGVTEMAEVWGRDGYHGEAMKILWPYFAVPHTEASGNVTAENGATKRMQLGDPPHELTFKPSAHMAVRKELILMRPKHTYSALLQQLQVSNDIPGYYKPRQMCCAMERMWHIFFGEPAVMSKRSMAADLLNITHCVFCDPVARLDHWWWQKHVLGKK